MSYERRNANLGKRERLARKQHKRGKISVSQSGWKKVGHEHFRRHIHTHLAVADSRKGKRVDAP